MNDTTPNEMVIRAEWIAAMTTPNPDESWDGITEDEASARWDAFMRKVRTDAARKAWELCADTAGDLMGIGGVPFALELHDMNPHREEPTR